MNGQKVLIRSYAAGVFFGTLVSETFTLSGKVVVLENSRNMDTFCDMYESFIAYLHLPPQ